MVYERQGRMEEENIGTASIPANLGIGQEDDN